jgi:crotonobetainyl-CoA:carnitine CoA-transferase CaiB-like acyl-CoA transferase
MLTDLGAEVIEVVVNPRIIDCSLSGYGQTGPYRDRPGHDLDDLAVAGLLGLLAGPGATPVPPGVQIAHPGDPRRRRLCA